MIKSLLVAMDASAHAQAGLEHAVALARAYEARITGVNVVDMRYAEMPPYIDYSYSFEGALSYMPPLDLMEKFQEKGERILGDLSDLVREAGLPVETRAEEGVPGQVVADMAREHDVVVLGERGEHAKWGRDLLGSTAEAVIRRSVVPVLLAEEEYHVVGKALVMFDDSEPANRALRLAADITNRMSLKLSVLTVSDDEEQGETVLEVARAYLGPLAVAADYSVRPGSPAQAAAAELDERPFDLLVMGTRGHSAIHDLILGRTAEQVMRSIKAPVLMVP